MAYAILRFTKQHTDERGLEAHHERRKEKYRSNPDIDTARSAQNYHIIRPQGTYQQEIEYRLQRARCRVRKDSVRFVDVLATASPDFFKEATPASTRAYFQTAADFLTGEIGADNIISAVVHLDEKTPHMHLCFTPITQDGRLSAKEILGNKKKLTEWQDKYYDHMSANFPDLQRGRAAVMTGRKHLPPQLFKQSVYLGHELEQIRSDLSNVGPFNASKKRDEVLQRLERWYPQVEQFETQLQLYEKSLEAQKTENAHLRGRVGELEQLRQDVLLELMVLRNDLRKHKREMKKLPPEVLASIKDKKQKEKEV